MTDPIKNFSPLSYPKGSVTQYFGENKALYTTVCAAPGVCLTQGHNGWDIVAAWGTPIFSVMGGKVVEVNDSPKGYGKDVRVLVDRGEGRLLEWIYGHLSRIDVTLGQQIEEGHQIGLMGNTGFVVSGATPYWKYNPYAGTHLHLGVRELEKWVSGNWTIMYPSGDKALIDNYTNGFLGSVDPYPFFISTMPNYDPTKYNLTGQSIINHLKLLYAALNNK